VYPEFMPLEDEVLPAEEQPLPAAVLPTADSLGYVLESDLEEDDDEDPEEDPADYPADGGDDDDDEDESSDDDEDDDIDIEGDQEEEHLAHADSTVVALPAVDHAPSSEETKPFETDESVATPPPHPAYSALLLGYRSEMSHLHYFGLIQPDSLLYLLYHHHHFPHGHHHCLRFLLHHE
ncbi:hypothetical protein Tco_0288555, partial [Tanacetum coccineum]